MLLPSTSSDGRSNVDSAARTFAEYGDFIYAIIYHKIKDDNTANDLYQDFFLSLVSSPIPAHVHNIKSYLYKAIQNDVIDASRRIQRYQTLMDKYADYVNFSINKNCSGNAFDIEGQAGKIFKLIGGQLKPSEAKAIILRYRYNHSIEEVAQKMNVKKESVSRYICIGLNKIRQSLWLKRGS